jgi:glycine cleavage system aminomethyltransferase T
MAEREGWMVAADFGSLATELATTRAAAGLADLSSIGKFEVSGPATALAGLDPAGRDLRPGRTVRVEGTWWCPLSPETLLVLCAPASNDRVRADLGENTAGSGITVRDVTSTRVALALLGPRAAQVLARAGAAAAPRGAVRLASIDGIPTLIIHEHELRWLLVAPADDGPALWNVLSGAGAPVGLAYVGADALDHLETSRGT